MFGDQTTENSWRNVVISEGAGWEKKQDWHLGSNNKSNWSDIEHCLESKMRISRMVLFYYTNARSQLEKLASEDGEEI